MMLFCSHSPYVFCTIHISETIIVISNGYTKEWRLYSWVVSLMKTPHEPCGSSLSSQIFRPNTRIHFFRALLQRQNVLVEWKRRRKKARTLSILWRLFSSANSHQEDRWSGLSKSLNDPLGFNKQRSNRYEQDLCIYSPPPSVFLFLPFFHLLSWIISPGSLYIVMMNLIRDSFWRYTWTGLKSLYGTKRGIYRPCLREHVSWLMDMWREKQRERES